MPIVIITKEDDRVCDLCRSMHGKADGDGWNSALGQEIDLWKKQPDGRYVRITGEASRGPDPMILGSPPFHPGCRCKMKYRPA